MANDSGPFDKVIYTLGLGVASSVIFLGMIVTIVLVGGGLRKLLEWVLQ